MATSSPINLGKLLNTVATNLAADQSALNSADTYNQDHGSNIVQVFKTAAKAVRTHKKESVAKQLASAGAAIAKTSSSGSAQYYAQGFSQAASQFEGQQLTSDNMMTLVTSLLSGGQTPAPAQPAQEQPGGMLGSLLGGLLGGAEPTAPAQPAQGQPGGLLGGLLGGLAGSSGGTNPHGLDIGDLMNAGVGYMQAKGRGEDDLQAIVSAVIAASPLGSSPHRAQSAQIIAGTLLQQVRKMTAGKKK